MGNRNAGENERLYQGFKYLLRLSRDSNKPSELQDYRPTVETAFSQHDTTIFGSRDS